MPPVNFTITNPTDTTGATLDIIASIPQRTIIYLQGTSDGDISANIGVDVTICGNEVLDTLNKTNVEIV